MSVPDTCKLAIVGGGPAGLTAAIYAGRAGLAPQVFVGIETSSQLLTTTKVENYPGFSSILGPDLVQQMLDQAQGCGANIIYEDVNSIDLKARPFVIGHGYDGHLLQAEAIIFATGSQAVRLDVPGENKFWQKGISACAVCDQDMAKGKVTFVIGGGDVACEEASHLSHVADKVYMVLRRDQFRASQAMVDRVKSNPKIQIIYDSVVDSIEGDKRVSKINLKNVKTGVVTSHDAQALFWAVGHKPLTDLLAGQVEMEGGYIKTKGDSQVTSVPGFFAAGDCCDRTYRQAVVAAGSGAKAALDAERWLASLK